MLASQSKKLLKNTIAQTDTHNKAWEERLCWKQRELEEEHLRKFSHRRSSSTNKHGAEEGPSCSSKKSRTNDNEEPYHWTKKLYDFEAADSERWGHAGYKDLYPEQFDGVRSSSSNKKINKGDNLSEDECKVKRRKRSSSTSTEESRSKRSKKKKRKKSKKKRSK